MLNLNYKKQNSQKKRVVCLAYGRKIWRGAFSLVCVIKKRASSANSAMATTTATKASGAPRASSASASSASSARAVATIRASKAGFITATSKRTASPASAKF